VIVEPRCNVIKYLSSIALTKLDILDGLDEIKVGTYYRLGGKRITRYPASEAELRSVEVEYETFRGWKSKIADVRSWDELPNEAKVYVMFIQDFLQVPGEFTRNSHLNVNNDYYFYRLCVFIIS